MRAGDLRHRVALQSSTIASRAASGESVLTWATYATVWAEVNITNNAEGTEENRNTIEETITAVIRYSSTVAAVNANQQLIWNSNTYRIKGAVTDTLKTMITTTAIRRI